MAPGAAVRHGDAAHAAASADLSANRGSTLPSAPIGPSSPTTVALPVPADAATRPKVYDSRAAGSASSTSQVAVPDPPERTTGATPTAVPLKLTVPLWAAGEYAPD